ncbi:MAG: isoprenylcysteine carboxylmethyltransferase family protein [Thermodesulfobacteriota bacterium]
MDKFILKGIVANVVTGALFLACLFIPAGTIHYWQAWVFFIVFEVSGQALGVYFLVHDRKVLERRVEIGPTAEKEPAQKIISVLFLVGFAFMIIFPALDHRYGWSPVPAYMSVLGDMLVAVSLLANIPILKTNKYAASTIRVEEGQPVVSTGPYAWVRHPMYSVVMILLVGIPLALGSWLGLLWLAAFFPVLAWRLLDEERFLRQNLPGYDEYTQKVRYRLVPHVW